MFAGSESILHLPVVQLCIVVRRRVLLLRFMHHRCVLCVTCRPDLPDSLGNLAPIFNWHIFLIVTG